ncbi:hypothetical protein ACEWY4_018890 [Coilia grayii]|uniref:Rho GTPase-activating protein 29 n=1 Tax=Coilia grayii TaxID=363190 RepID=A0ABD1JG31_9TELE
MGSLVVGVNFKEVNEENKQKLFGEIYTSIDTLAFTFGNVVSDFLMGDVENGSALGLPQTRRSRSFENLCVESGEPGPEKDEPPGPSPPARVEEVDAALHGSLTGVESALLYAKAWSKYTKDLLSWVEKRINLDIECAKSFAKMAESAKALASQQEFMPFKEIYTTAFKNDIEYSQVILHTTAALQANKFIQPLQSRKSELDRLRKEVKEQWQREQKKMHEADSALRKARLLQAQRQEDYEKARNSTSRAEEEAPAAGSGTAASKQLEKRRRLEEEALQRAVEAKEHCRACVNDVAVRKVDLAKAKRQILTQIRELVFQCDLTLKAVTVNWFQMQQAQVVSLPVNYQSLCESAKLYEPGQRYTEFVRSLPTDRSRGESFTYDLPATQNSGFSFNKQSMSSSHSSHGNLSQTSVTSGDFLGADEVESPVHTRPAKISERRSNSSTDIQALRIQGPFRAWGTGNQGGGMCSDSESAGGSSESRSMDSPTASPGDFKRRLPRTPSTGTMSSADDLDEREPPSPSDNGGLSEMVTETASSPGPFRNAQMSKAAQTHKLRKLRAPSKCRECDGLVVFHGAECEECSLACHKKCLETLAIQCGHKKLHGKLHLFGIDFAQAAKNSSDGIPFIVKKCTSEIENRALNIKGIYRVNGAKSRVEKLCQAFENGKDLVELSDLYPHDISNVLKLYLRQLPEPLILFRYYNDFIGLAKESQSIIVEEVEASRGSLASETRQVSVELNRVLFKIRDLLRQLPPTHYKTLQFLVEHLHRVTEKADENKMTASNLGIIFGPTLIKPRQTDAEVSLSSLVDYPYQALIVELLIRHFQMIFDAPLSPLPVSPTVGESSPLPIKSRLTPQEKERQLSRHSTSLVDIKEQHNAKTYKRHSSVIPSTHLMDEVKEAKPRTDGREFAPVMDTDSATINGLLSASSPEIQSSPRFPRSISSITIPITSSSSASSASPTSPTTGPVSLCLSSPSRVQLRPPRPKLSSRPVSLPPERLLNARNAADAARTQPRDAAIEEASEEEPQQQQQQQLQQRSGLKTRSGTPHHRSTYIDTQTLRRKWDREYKRYDVTARTAMIVAKLPGKDASSGVDGVAATTTTTSPTFNAIPQLSTSMPSKGYFPERMTGSIGSSRQGRGGLRREGNVSEYNPVPTAFRPPRTLQPPPGTFYKPPVVGRAKSLTEISIKPSAPVATAEDDDDDDEEQVLEIEVSVDGPCPETETQSPEPHSPSQSPSSSPEDFSQSEAKPVYQRLRSRRLQEFEHREAHFV